MEWLVEREKRRLGVRLASSEASVLKCTETEIGSSSRYSKEEKTTVKNWLLLKYEDEGGTQYIADNIHAVNKHAQTVWYNEVEKTLK